MFNNNNQENAEPVTVQSTVTTGLSSMWKNYKTTICQIIALLFAIAWIRCKDSLKYSKFVQQIQRGGSLEVFDLPELTDLELSPDTPMEQFMQNVLDQ